MQQRTSRALSAALAAAALAIAGCGGDSKGDRQTAVCPEITPASDLSLIPKDITLDRHSTVTTVAKSRGFIGVVAVSDRKVVELFPILSRALVDSRYVIRSSDNEGFEAEIFFTSDRNTGSLILRQDDCAGATNIILTYGA